MNSIMQRVSSALGVAAMGVLISRQTAQASADLGAPQTPQSTGVSPTGDRQALLGLYELTHAHVAAIADSDMFLVAATASAGCALLTLMRRRAPARQPTPAPVAPGPAPRSVAPRSVEPRSSNPEIVEAQYVEPDPVELDFVEQQTVERSRPAGENVELGNVENSFVEQVIVEEGNVEQTGVGP